MTELSVTGISKRFAGVRALNDVTLEFPSGAVTALMGENGAGKSTLIKIMTGDYLPDAGEITLDGRPLRLHTPADARRAGLAGQRAEVDVLGHRHVRHDLRLLRDHPDAGPPRVGRRVQTERPAVEGELPRVRQVVAGHDLGEGGLAGPVLPHERRHRPAGELQRDVVQRPYAGEPLGDPRNDQLGHETSSSVSSVGSVTGMPCWSHRWG